MDIIDGHDFTDEAVSFCSKQQHEFLLIAFSGSYVCNVVYVLFIHTKKWFCTNTIYYLGCAKTIFNGSF